MVECLDPKGDTHSMRASKFLVSLWMVASVFRVDRCPAQEAPAKNDPVLATKDHDALASVQKQVPASNDLYSDTWVGTDALGRVLPSGEAVRSIRKDRFVGAFYFLTHGSAEYYKPHTGPFDYNTYGDDPRVLRDNSETIRRLHGDPLTKPEGWKEGGTYWWGEPAVGYFLADDPWVARRNLQMLAVAGVDVIIFDVTNAPQYTRAYKTVLSTALEMRRQSVPTPQFAFITYSSSGIVANQLYDDIYAKNLYRELWFEWQGKPLIFGDPKGSKPNPAPARPEVAEFFTWRYSWANTRGPTGDGKDEWQWSDSGSPLTYGWHDDPKKPEEVSVMAGGWANPRVGRSFAGSDRPGLQRGKEPDLDALDLAADVDKGTFFAQQWDSALKIDPEFVFVTGWNEWDAGRQYGPGITMLGQVTKPGQCYFVDNFNEEFSRDLMPMKGGYGDNYYMQLIDYVRRFKGARPTPVTHGYRTMNLDDSFTAWQDIPSFYRDAAGDTSHRDWSGWGGKQYINITGRNDIVEAKVVNDVQTVWFYVRTQDKLTPFSDLNWMSLLIDADSSAQTGWNGYDFVVNHPVIDASTTTFRRLTDDRTWQVKYRMKGNEMVIAVPRVLLGLTDPKRLTFDFHWADNVPIKTGNVADWWYLGDNAPDGRLNYRYIDVP